MERLAHKYQDGSLLSGGLKEIAAEQIADFLNAHLERRAKLGPIEDELTKYRLTDHERKNPGVGLDIQMIHCPSSNCTIICSIENEGRRRDYSVTV